MPPDAGVTSSDSDPAEEETEVGAEETTSALAVEDGDREDRAQADESEEESARIDDLSAREQKSPLRMALVMGLVCLVPLGALTGWLGYRAYQSHQTREQRAQFLQVARQGALNLTTIDHEHADADVRRVLDSATGQFYDEFAQRSQPFIDVVKRAQSRSTGTVTAAGLESVSGDHAQAIVAVTVNTSSVGATEQAPRSWRMRLIVQKVGQDVKVSKVEFVP